MYTQIWTALASYHSPPVAAVAIVFTAPFGENCTLRNLINLDREESLHGRGNHCALYKVGALSLSTSVLDGKSVSTGLLTSSANGDLKSSIFPQR